MGDSIDNIPGARDPNIKPAPGERRKPGIGDVGAKQLIQEYGSAEEVLKQAANVKRSSYREALQNCAKFVTLSKQLATIPTDAPVKLDLDSLILEEPNIAALHDLYVELGFSSLLRELTPLAAMHTDDEPTDYAALDSAEGLATFLKAVPAGRDTAVWLGLSTEEDDEEGFGTAVLSVEVSSKETLARTSANDIDNKSLGAMRDFLADTNRAKIVHDPKLFTLLATKDCRDPRPSAGIKHATALYSYLLRPTTAKHNFAEVVLRHLNRTLSGAAGERADFLMRVAPVLRDEVEKQGLLDVYEKIDLPLAPVLARMEACGVRVDPAELGRIATNLSDEMAKLEKVIFELAGSEFNINSPQQLAEVLFDKLNLTPPRMGRFKPKSRSTAADVLEELSEVHDMPKRVIEYRELSKLKSNYADQLPRLIYPLTSRLHTSFCQTGTATGRLSSSNPNLQNIPVRSEIGREIRAAFVADPGHLLLSADYSQIELRILAHLSHDALLTEAFQRGEDIHSRTAQEVFGVGPLAQTREHRRVAKVINFGVIYGLSAFGLAQRLGIEQKEAAHFINVYFERYSGVKKFIDAQDRRNAQNRLRPHHVRPRPPHPRNQFATSADAQFRRAHRDEHADAERRRRPDQARHDRARPPPPLGKVASAHDASSPRRIALRSPRSRNPEAPRPRERRNGKRPQIRSPHRRRNKSRPELARHEVSRRLLCVLIFPLPPLCMFSHRSRCYNSSPKREVAQGDVPWTTPKVFFSSSAKPRSTSKKKTSPP